MQENLRLIDLLLKYCTKKNQRNLDLFLNNFMTSFKTKY